MVNTAWSARAESMQSLQRFMAMQRSSARVAEHRARFSWRPVAVVIVGAAFLSTRRGADVDGAAPSRSAALSEVLETRGLSSAPEDVTWITGPAGVVGAMTGGARALVRAHAGDEPTDLYLVSARLSPEGVLLDVGNAWNITRTSGVDESRPIVRATDGGAASRGQHMFAAYSTSVDGLATGIHTIDLAGRSPSLYTDFTRTQRWQTAGTNLQETGQAAGVLHSAFALDPVANHVTLAWREDGMLSVLSDERAIVIDPRSSVAIEGAGWVRDAPEIKAPPTDLVHWAVDRTRRMEWFGDKSLGDEGLQWLKAIAFTGLDFFLRVQTRIFGDSSAREVADDLGGVNSGQTEIVYTDPETGWPPMPMTPFMTPALAGEGEWIALDHDPFVAQQPGVPSAFVTSFIRTDKLRKDTRIYVTLWDPRQIALHMEAGTVEPVSATGEAGPGLIPRAPEVMRRVVAGFNGGFQAMHGEYGMQASGVLYLPPKPYAATVVELRDGSTGFGAWPPTSDVPEDILSYRQNLTAIVQNGKWNPWGRVWWGGTPPGWKDDVHTTRSGICLTKESFVGYFYGIDISADVLAQGMLSARCAFGIHLDMNPGLAGFEFYNVQPKETWRPLGRKLAGDWEYEGTISDLPDFHYRARRMVRSMVEINFPQYLRREGRDFFYLTQRPVLPGAELATAPRPDAGAPLADGEGTWRVKGLPQHGFPYAIATTWVRPDVAKPDLKVRALRLDPRTVRAAGSAGTTVDTPTVVSFFGPQLPKGDELGVWLTSGVLVTGAVSPAKDATLIAVGETIDKAARPENKPPELAKPSLAPPGPPPVARPDEVRAAVGIEDEDGMLVWLELEPGFPSDAGTAKMLDTILATAGCTSRLLVRGNARALLGGSLDLAAAPVAPPSGTSSRLVRGTPPAAHLVFESTPIVGPSIWQPLQMKRVRYFPKASTHAADAGAPPAGEHPDAGAPTDAGRAKLRPAPQDASLR